MPLARGTAVVGGMFLQAVFLAVGMPITASIPEVPPPPSSSSHRHASGGRMKRLASREPLLAGSLQPRSCSSAQRSAVEMSLPNRSTAILPWQPWLRPRVIMHGDPFG